MSRTGSRKAVRHGCASNRDAHRKAGSSRGKALKPEWLTHEAPDSWERIAAELREMDEGNLIPYGNGDYRPDARHGALADRIERLAKEGAEQAMAEQRRQIDDLRADVARLTAERDECADAADAAERKLRQLDRGSRLLYGRTLE